MMRPFFVSSPSKFNDIVPLWSFQQAKLLLMEERVDEAIELLEGAILSPALVCEGNVVGGDALISLYAEILFSAKKFSLLQELFIKWDTTNDFPLLKLVELRMMDFDGRYSDCIEGCTQLIEEYRESNWELLPGFIAARGRVHAKTGNLTSSLVDMELAYSFFLFQEKPFQMGFCANAQGMLYRQLGDFYESRKWLERGLKSFTKLSLPRKQSMTLLNLGVTHYKSGNLKAAHKSLTESHKIGEEGNWPHRMLFTNIALGNVYRMKRQKQRARQHLHTAYAQAQELGYPREEALAMEFLGDVFRDENQFEQAMRFYARAMAIGKSIAPKGDIVMEVYRRQGECLLGEGEYVKAIGKLKKSITMAKAQGDRFEEAAALRVFSEVKKAVGDFNTADDLITESVEILEKIGARFELALSLSSWSDLKLRQVDRGDHPIPAGLLLTQAWNYATKALEHAIFSGVKPMIEEYRHKARRLSKLRAAQDLADQKQATKNKGSKAGLFNSNPSIIHQSSEMRDVVELTDMFANTEEPVLITGETGTGKELVAKRLHMNSDRSANKLVCVNVTTLPATMFEREMFGHVRGSFSGADRDGKGYVAEAEGGTLFLDEIGELPLDMQPKLLRLLQEGTYQSLGDPTERYANIRIVAATNASLPKMVKEGTFRSDLYFRLRVLELDLPPLRRRTGDVLFLLRHFLSEAAGHPTEASEYFNAMSLDLLQKHTWPGNIRELNILARRAHVEIKTRGFTRVMVKEEDGKSFYAMGPETTVIIKKKLAELEMHAAAGVNHTVGNPIDERGRILLVLEQCNGNRIDAAARLGMSRTTLYRRIKKLGLD